MSIYLRRAAIGLAGMAACVSGAHGQGSAPLDPAIAVEQLFAKVIQPGSPGCSVGASRGVTTVLEAGYGMASLEHEVGIAPRTRFHAASITKTTFAVTCPGGRSRSASPSASC
jgi:CubicO group peptidase (beta-lactamase class C family)